MRLSQILALEKGIKTKAASSITAAHKTTQKAGLAVGFLKTYVPSNEEGETCPPESQKVQCKVEDVIDQVSKDLAELFDITAVKDWTNCKAKADVFLNGSVFIRNVPATYLLFLEKQLIDLRTFVSKITELDPSKEWRMDENSGLFRTDPSKTQRTKKIQCPIVLYDATPDHPAQTQLITRDEVVGHWSTVYNSGAIAPTRKMLILDRIEKLIRAVKLAREEANSIEEENVDSIGNDVMSYLFD